LKSLGVSDLFLTSPPVSELFLTFFPVRDPFLTFLPVITVAAATEVPPSATNSAR